MPGILLSCSHPNMDKSNMAPFLVKFGLLFVKAHQKNFKESSNDCFLTDSSSKFYFVVIRM